VKDEVKAIKKDQHSFHPSRCRLHPLLLLLGHACKTEFVMLQNR
jgi:hypothetical protein